LTKPAITARDAAFFSISSTKLNRCLL
jgi:hypothetical protein